MTGLPWRSILLATGSYVLLNQLWLAGGNATWVAPEHRAIVKGVSLLLALGVFLALALHVARHAASNWLLRTAMAGALSVGIALAIAVAMSIFWYRGQFFHGTTVVERLPVLILLVLGATVAAGTLAMLAGALARQL